MFIFNLFFLSKLLFIKNFKNDNSVFTEVANLQLDIIKSLHLIQKVNIDFSEKHSHIINNAYINNLYFTNPQFRKVRLTHFVSENKQLFNSVWYPSYEYNAPILSIDMVKNKDRALCFVNLIEIEKNKYTQPFIELKQNYPELNEKNIKPLKPYEKYLNDAMLYGHIYDLNKFQTIIPKALKSYFTIYLNTFQKTTDIDMVKKKHIEYNNFRIKKDLKIMPKDFFEPEWYSAMIHDYYK
jgi:hypothetical protein